LGHDLNRDFFRTEWPEVKNNIEIIKDKVWLTGVISWRSESVNHYYVYEVNCKRKPLVLKHNQILKNKGVGLVEGLDDPNDPDLGYGWGRLHKTQHTDGEDDRTISADTESSVNNYLLRNSGKGRYGDKKVYRRVIFWRGSPENAKMRNWNHKQRSPTTVSIVTWKFTKMIRFAITVEKSRKTNRFRLDSGFSFGYLSWALSFHPRFR
jgi:hypothetical protein